MIIVIVIISECETDDFGFESEMPEDAESSYEYELTGVTVHTGTADGGHYYSFIRDRLHPTDSGQDKWLVPPWFFQSNFAS